MFRLTLRRALPLALCACLAHVALAHPDHDDLSRWYRSLKNHAGFSCCSEADCSPVDARQVGEEWQIFDNGAWETGKPCQPEPCWIVRTWTGARSHAAIAV